MTPRPVFVTLKMTQEDARVFLRDVRNTDYHYLLTPTQEHVVPFEVLRVEGQTPCPHEYEDGECVWCGVAETGGEM